MFFFWKFTYALFGNVCFVKFGTFSALLALPVMMRGGGGTDKSYMKRFLTSCSVMRGWLRSRASLGLWRATHLIWARWVTAARVPLPHWCKRSRPYRHPRPAPAVHGPAYFAAFARSANKRPIAVGKFERNVKDHLSMFKKLRFRVLRRSRNDTFFACICKYFVVVWPSSGGSMSETVLLMRPCWWLTGQFGPPPLPSAAAHTDWPRAEALRRRAQLVLSLATFPTAEAMWEAKHNNLFTNACKNVSFLFHRRTRNPGHGKVVFHIALEFSDYDELFVRNSSESGQIGRAIDSRRGAGPG